MEDKELKELIKDSRKTLVIKLVGAATGLFVSACIGLTIFYFNTNHVTAQNTNNIEKVSKDVKKIKDDVGNMKTIPVLNQAQISNVNKDIEELNKRVDKIDDKIEKVDEKMDRVVEMLIRLERRNPN